MSLFYRNILPRCALVFLKSTTHLNISKLISRNLFNLRFSLDSIVIYCRYINCNKIVGFLPDIDPSSLEWLLLLLSVVILLLLLFSIDDGAIADVGDVFSSTSWSSLQYSVPPSLSANSSPIGPKKPLIRLCCTNVTNKTFQLTRYQLPRTRGTPEALNMINFGFSSHHKVIFTKWTATFITFGSKESRVVPLAVRFSIANETCATFIQKLSALLALQTRSVPFEVRCYS